jgi:hypothetical protein
MATTATTPPASLRFSIYILELFSGHGHVSDTAAWMLDCPRWTVDFDPSGGPSQVKDIGEWTAQDSEDLKARFPERRPIVFASPPCENYSRMNTTGKPDLEAADALVAKVREISEAIGAVAVFVENPGTGKLYGREVMDGGWVPHSYLVDYCQYGHILKKRTRIWCSLDLESTGFVPRVCSRTEAGCQAFFKDPWTGTGRHVGKMVDMTWDERIVVPRQLIACLMRAALPLVNQRMTGIREEMTRASLAAPRCRR